MSAEQLLATLHFAMAILMIAVGLPLWAHRIRPNLWYGFRTPATLRDERIWYPVNQETGGWLIVTGLVTLPVVIATFALGLPVPQLPLVNLVPFVTGLFVMVVRGFLRIHRLQRELSAK